MQCQRKRTRNSLHFKRSVAWRVLFTRRNGVGYATKKIIIYCPRDDFILFYHDGRNSRSVLVARVVLVLVVVEVVVEVVVVIVVVVVVVVDGIASEWRNENKKLIEVKTSSYTLTHGASRGKKRYDRLIRWAAEPSFPRRRRVHDSSVVLFNLYGWLRATTDGRGNLYFIARRTRLHRLSEHERHGRKVNQCVHFRGRVSKHVQSRFNVLYRVA